VHLIGFHYKNVILHSVIMDQMGTNIIIIIIIIFINCNWVVTRWQ